MRSNPNGNLKVKVVFYFVKSQLIFSKLQETNCHVHPNKKGNTYTFPDN